MRKVIWFKAILRNRVLIWLFTFLTFVPPHVHSQNAFPPNDFSDVLEQFECFVEESLIDWNVPGAAVTIVKDDSIVFLKGFGVRAVDSSQKIDSHTVFRLASVSKGFASVLTGLLVQENVLEWDAPVTKFLPDFRLRDRNATKNLTLRHVLSHTTGLPPHAYTNLLEDDVPYQKILKKLRKVKSIFPPGERYAYQNILYAVIGDVVKSATGKTYENLIEEYIFGPLGMKNASLGYVSFLMSANRAEPHIRDSYQWAVTDVKKAYYEVPPSAGVNASIADMAKWLRAMMGGNPAIIPPEVITKVTTRHARTPQELRKYRWRDGLTNAHYGLGWRIYHYGDTKIVYHGGWVQGFRAEIGFIPDKKIGIVALVNAETRMAGFFLPKFFDLYLNLPKNDVIHTE